MAGIFGWSFGNSWQRGLEHRWCAGGCGMSLDWFQEAFLRAYPNPMCQPCGMERDARVAALELENERREAAAIEADRQWAELHVVRTEVPCVTMLPANVVPLRPVLEEANE